MRIAVLGIRGLPANYGGFETCAEHTTKHWVAIGHDVLVYCRKSHYENQLEAVSGVKLTYVGSIPIKGIETLSHTFFSIINLIFFHSEYRYIHLYNSGNGIFIPFLKLFGKKVIISVDGIEWKREKWGFIAKFFHKLGANLAVKFSNKIITDNQEVYNFYKEKFGIESEIIEYGAKFIYKNEFSGEFLNKYNLKRQEYYIFIGRLVPEKGVHHLIDAYLKLKTNKPLVIIGDDTTETSYRNDLFKKGEANYNIIMTGFLYNNEYEELLSNSYLYISASELEGTSPSLLAAMGAKVCTLVNGIDENLQTINSSGIAFDKLNYQDLLKKWEYCENNPSYVYEMANKGYNHVKANYQWEGISKKYLKLFKYL
ncbi:glycosyltransferase [Yeosuana marina]|uniref:glycosyltransferase n=1 Tax=Yeosuana marina TaxID=1565536 RepID=UPI00142056A5|nr:glycosyltransferase [Yeosuana marina]